ncbi:hypothetical protein JB92DRAFT_2735765 [Gautieria morchelliformis]|nr:hypothetical protein JB92DRAFT_2735765 [Gautieria morchelliformis]
MSTDSIPTKQNAWLIVRRGSPGQSIVLKKDVSVPSQLGKGEVLVKVHAAALNPVGYKVMQTLPNFIARSPHVAEHDLAGVIVDPNDSEFKQGDEVFGWLPVPMTLKTGQGALAQYARVHADQLARKPESIDFTQAAGISLAAMTAYQGLKLAKIKAGQAIFVNGGSSSVGSFAIQIAKAKGCKVVSSCSTANVELVKSLGADEVIDYKLTPVAEHFVKNPPSPKFHAVFDAIGSTELFTSSPAYLDGNGIFASVGASGGGVANLLVGLFKTMIWPAWLGGTRRTYKFILVDNKKADLEAIRNLVEEGKVKTLVDSVYAFEDVLKAYARIMSGHAKGKVVVTVVT